MLQTHSIGKKTVFIFLLLFLLFPLPLQLTITMTANVTIKIVQYAPLVFWYTRFRRVLSSQRFNMLR